NMPTPASINLRLLAGIIDGNLLFVSFAFVSVLVPMMTMFAPDVPSLQSSIALGALLYQSLYFSILEGVWGASLGKAICHLRVVGPRRNAAGFRAPLRFVIFRFSSLIGIFLSWSNSRLTFLFTSALPGAIARLAFFITARRENGYAALHDLITNTRVVAVPREKPQRTSEMQQVLIASAKGLDPIGPYKVLTWVKTPAVANAVFVGEDPKLHRKVWVHRTPDGSPPLPVNRRDMHRSTR